MKFVKKLGQNFLVNQAALKKIVSALAINKEETIIEIGAGSGNLTREILKTGAEVIAIEKDQKLTQILRSEIQKTFPNLKIIEADIRETLEETTKNLTNYKVVGNIPYYLTGRLFRTFQQLENPPQIIILTIQKEVAQRIVALPPSSNQLAAIIDLWAKPKILFNLKPKDFHPSPKVHSCVIKLEIRPKNLRLKNEERVISLIKTGFSQPRKTLLNNLSIKFSKNAVSSALKQLNLNEKIRPQDLSRELWIKLTENPLSF